jgi:hypothetical protein
MKRADVLLIGGILLLAAVLFAFRILMPAGGALVAVLTVNGDEVRAFPLSGAEYPFEYLLQGGAGGEIVIRAERRRIRILRSDCPDGDCVRTGWLSRPGDAAVCLPNRLVLKIAGEAEYDAVTY